MSRQSHVYSRPSTMLGTTLSSEGSQATSRGRVGGRRALSCHPQRAGRARGEVRLLLQGGHRVDPRNNSNAVRDVAIQAARVGHRTKIDPAGHRPRRAVRLFVPPGSRHSHACVRGKRARPESYAGTTASIPSSGAALRTPTGVDVGGSGWRNFEDFKQRIIDRASTRVLAFLNIVGHGMRGGKFEQDLQDMAAQPTADMARRYPGVIVGVKTAHFSGPEWAPVERAVEAGTLANIPVMVDFGSRRTERPLSELVTVKLRPNDI